MTSPAPQLRADAERNRAAIISAATEAFAADGTNLTLEQVAGRAGVGVGTIYRRFSTIEALLAVVLETKMTDYALRAEQAAADALTRPWEAFSDFVMYVLEQQAENLALAEISIPSARCDALFPVQSHRIVDSSVLLVDRAKAAGALRPDFEHRDLWLLKDASATLGRTSSEGWQRLAFYMLEAFRQAPLTN